MSGSPLQAPSSTPATLVPATLVGSLPRPKWLISAPSWGQWLVPPEALPEAQDDAVRAAVLDQLAAGLDVVTDGEQRREHFVWGFLRGLQGPDFGRVEPKPTRGNRYPHPAPHLAGPLRWSGPIHERDVRFLVELARLRPGTRTKVTLPGPMTVADEVWDDVYGDRRALALDVAAALNQEARALAALGCDVVQFDEPTFNVYLDDVEAWGIETLDRAAAGVPARTAVHVCYGYGGSRAAEWKRQNTDWTQYERLLPLLAQSAVDQVSLEFAQPRLAPDVLRRLGPKTVLFGAVDTGWDPPEPVESVAARLRGALEHVPPERLYASSDCGFASISRDLARQKLAVLVAAADLVRKEIAS